ncbi:MAG: sigma 54-interacting transcriptional regulator, partial [candidate division Zixibacteria bacterium]|nr:sigma 54-interacting transcriptional regulator [candidate division Zixibacteria bacterium]
FEEIKKVETREKIEEFSTEGRDLCYLSAVVLYRLGNYREAKSKAESAYDLLKNTSEHSKVAQIQDILGRIYLDLGDLKNAENYVRDAITTYRRIGDQVAIINCYNTIARIFFIKSDYQKAVEYLHETKELSEEIGDSKMTAAASGNLGRIYILMGEWEKAKENLLISLRFNETHGDRLNLCKCQLSLGFLCCLKREFQKASEYLTKAFELADKNKYLRELVIYHEYMGSLKFDLGDYKKAEDHYNQIIKIWETTAPDGDMISQTYRLLAELQVAKKEYDQALIFCQKSLEVSKSLGEKIEEGTVYRILGQIHSAKGDKELALEYFNKSISYLQQIGAKYELAKTYLETGRSKEFDYYKRLGFLSNAEIEFRGLGSFYYLGQVNLSIANLLADDNQYDKAQLFLTDAEKFFKEAKEQKAVCQVCDLRHTIENALFRASMIAKSNGRNTFDNIITQNDEMREVIEKLKQIKDYDISILLEGETGTGKDLLAKAIHYSGKRKDKRFIAVSCAALPESLLENELFGHKRGAYTGADKDESGLFEEAEGGTLYLDEIAEVPLSTQVKLLRAIEEKEIVRLGETTPRKIDVRIVSSTSKDLKKVLNEVTFRQDLYYRLNTFQIKIPPLEQRKDDIPLLVRHFLKEYGIKDGDLKDFDLKKVVRRFSEYSWPGNVRELENELKRMVVLFQAGNGDPARLLSEKLHKFSQISPLGGENNQIIPSHGIDHQMPTNLSLFEDVAEFEKEKIIQALSQTNGIKLRAAKLLGIPEATLRNKMKKYQIKRSALLL